MIKTLIKNNWFSYFYSRKYQANRFRHAFINNPYGYLTFWDYWNNNFKQTTDILTEARKHKGRIGFIKAWLKTYKCRF